MKKFAVIGSPIDHSLSPLLHNFIFKQLNLNAIYQKINVPDCELKTVTNKIRTGQFDGMNVTIPYKSKIMKYVDEVNPLAEAIGAINVLMFQNKKVIGDNTDWYGFTLALNYKKINLNQKKIIIIGAGGVSRAIIFALKQLGATKIHVFNRTFEKIAYLCDEIIHPHEIDELKNVIQKDSIIINCTSVGMNSLDSPIDLNLLNKNQTVIDTIYTPLKTKLILNSEDLGADIMPGLDMFIYQGLASLDLWFGESISNKVNFDDLKYHIESNLC